MKDYKNILVIKMSSLGDIIHALPSLYALRELLPDACITWAIHESFAKILPGKPWIDNVYVIDRKRIKKINYLLQVRKDLHKKHFDLVIDLQMIAKSGLMSFLTGCHERIGYNDARECSGLFSRAISGKYKNGHIIEQLLDVIRYLGWQGSGIHFPLHDYKNELSVVREKLSEAGVIGKDVLLVPGTRGENKKWPIKYWGELAKRLAKKGVFCIISGTVGEKPMADEIRRIAQSKYVVDFIGKTNLLELIALEKMAAVHVSSDTGPLHIANAVGTPIIALFGPTLPYRSGPYGNRYSEVLLAETPGHEVTNMGTISVEAVYDSCMKKLSL